MSHDGGVATLRRKRPWISTLLVVALIAGLGAVVGFAFKDDGPRYPKTWDPRIAPLAEIAAKDRGLAFKHPVYVEFLSPEKFAAQVTTDNKSLSADDRKQLAQTQGMLRALGLISGDTDLLKETNTLKGSGILGLYSYQDKKIRVRGTELTPAVKVTLVHELTHVLQDQNFNLSATFKKIRANKFEDSAAFDALVEGDARRIENEYRSSLPQSVQADLTKSDNADVATFRKEATNVPPFLTTEMSAPYALGEIAVTRAANNGGNAAVDALFRTPPLHQIQLVQPWLMGQAWASQALVKPKLASGAKEIDRGEFGAFDLYLVLAERIPALDALTAVDGWGADQYLSYSQGGRTCVQASFTGTDDGSTARLNSALSHWAAGSAGSATISQNSSTVTMNACDPGASFHLPADHSEDALKLLAVRNTIEGQVEKEGASQGTAVCFAKAVSQRFSLAVLQADTVAPADAAAMREIVKTCMH